MQSMLWQKDAFSLEMFKTMLRSYFAVRGDASSHIADGIESMSFQGETFRFFSDGAVFFEMGWKINLLLDETAYVGEGYYIFAYILGGFLFSLAPLNMPVEIDFSTKQSGLVAVWKNLNE
jgi:type VI protein secretion system component VasA